MQSRNRLLLVFILGSFCITRNAAAQGFDEAVNAGYAAEQQQDYAAAIKEYARAHALEPENVELNDRLGLMYFKLTQYDSAIAYCSLAIKSDPNDSVGYYQRGHSYLEKEDYRQALTDFLRSFDLTSKRNGNSSFNVGKAYAGLHEYEKAREYYGITLSLMPDDKYSYFEIGYTFALQDQRDSALAYYTKAIEQDNVYFDAYLNRGLLYAVQFKDAASAHKDLAKSIEIRPKTKEPYLYDAAIYTESEDFGKAKERLDLLIGLAPDFSEAYFQRALTWYRIGILNMVCKDLDKALEFGHPQAAEIKEKLCK